MLPHEFALWTNVYDYFRRWKKQGLFTRLLDRLRRSLYVKLGREASPSAAIIDTQSIQTTRRGGACGSDGNKAVNGRKRYIVTDTLGLLLVVCLHQADLHKSQQAPAVNGRICAEAFGGQGGAPACDFR